MTPLFYLRIKLPTRFAALPFSWQDCSAWLLVINFMPLGQMFVAYCCSLSFGMPVCYLAYNCLCVQAAALIFLQCQYFKGASTFMWQFAHLMTLTQGSDMWGIVFHKQVIFIFHSTFINWPYFDIVEFLEETAHALAEDYGECLNVRPIPGDYSVGIAKIR